MVLSNPNAVTSVSQLRKTLRSAAVGTGQIRKLIDSCRFDITIAGFTTLIATCGKRGQCDKAREIFYAMESRGVRPNVITYTSLIAVFASAGRCSEALEFFRRMKGVSKSNAEWRVDHVVYRSLIPALAKAKWYRDVFHLFDEMIAAGFDPDRKILMALLRSLSASGRWSDAAMILESMHCEGMAATRQEYSEIITACSGVRGLDYAVETFLTMQMLGVDVNSEVCGALMLACEECERPDVGIALLFEMEKYKIDVALDVYNSLLRSLAREGMWEESLGVFKSMWRRGVKIDEESAAALVNSCSNAGEASLAMELRDKFKITMHLEIATGRVQGAHKRPAFKPLHTSTNSKLCG